MGYQDSTTLRANRQERVNLLRGDIEDGID